MPRKASTLTTDRERAGFAARLRAHLEALGEDEMLVARRLSIAQPHALALVKGRAVPTERERVALQQMVDGN